MPYHRFIHESKFSGQSGSVRLSDGRSVTWTASGRIGAAVPEPKPAVSSNPSSRKEETAMELVKLSVTIRRLHSGDPLNPDHVADSVGDSLTEAGFRAEVELLPTSFEPTFTVVGLHGDGSPFVQTFRCGTATRAVEVVRKAWGEMYRKLLRAGRFVATQRYGGPVRVVAVFPGVQIPDESWRPDSGQAQTYDGEIYEPQRVD